MVYVGLYWIVAGLATRAGYDSTGFKEQYPVFHSVVCMALGGLSVPIRILAKVID